MLRVIELVVGSAEVQTGGFESRLLSTQSWGSPAAAECGGSMVREFGLAVFLHGWRVNRPSLCLPTSSLVLLCPALSPELVSPLNPVCLPGRGDVAQDCGQASEAESSLGCGLCERIPDGCGANSMCPQSWVCRDRPWHCDKKPCAFTYHWARLLLL